MRKLLRSLKTWVALGSLLSILGCHPNSPPPPAACNPYAPTAGLFLTGVQTTAVPASPVTVGNFKIVGQGSPTASVLVTQAGFPNLSIVIPAPFTNTFFAFYASNRFLILDMRAFPSLGQAFYSQIVVDLSTWTTVQPPTPHQTPQVQLTQAANLIFLPSPGNGLAFLMAYGMGSNTVDNAAVFRSDNANQLCAAPTPQTFNTQVIAQITATSVQIQDGGQVVGSPCSLPAGRLAISPTALNFGSILANSTTVLAATFTNTGNDCLQVTNITSSVGQFQVVGSTSFALPPSASQQVQIKFNPNNAVGTFNGTVTVAATPPNGANSISLTGIATNPQPVLTLNKVLSPPGDPGRFNLAIDGSLVASSVGNGGSSGSKNVAVGNHIVSESAASGTNLAGYTTTIDCGSGKVTGTTTTITLAVGDNKTCTFTNSGPPALTLVKSLAPGSDPGRFNLLLDGRAVASSIGNGGNSGPQNPGVGSHMVSETAASGTNLASYSTTIDCGSGKTSGTSTSVSLSKGDNKTCTFTNTAPPNPPQFQPPGGQVACGVQKVTITSDPGTVIQFQINQGPQTTYSSPITVDGAETIQATATNSAGTSQPASASFTCLAYDTFDWSIQVGTDDARTDSAVQLAITTTSGSMNAWCLKYSDNGSTTVCPQSHPGITWQPSQTNSGTVSWNSGATLLSDFATFVITLVQFPGFGKSDDNFDIQAITLDAYSSTAPNMKLNLLNLQGPQPVQRGSCYARLKHPRAQVMCGGTKDTTCVKFNHSGIANCANDDSGAVDCVMDDDGLHTLPYCKE